MRKKLARKKKKAAKKEQESMDAASMQQKSVDEDDELPKGQEIDDIDIGIDMDPKAAPEPKSPRDEPLKPT